MDKKASRWTKYYNLILPIVIFTTNQFLGVLKPVYGNNDCLNYWNNQITGQQECLDFENISPKKYNNNPDLVEENNWQSERDSEWNYDKLISFCDYQSNNTPLLSELIDRFHQTRTRYDYKLVISKFLQQCVGVFSALPNVKNPSQLFSSISDSEGNKIILVYADPPLSEQNFGRKFNVLVSGKNVMTNALSDQSIKGIVINSGQKKLSFFIPRKFIQDLTVNNYLY